MDFKSHFNLNSNEIFRLKSFDFILRSCNRKKMADQFNKYEQDLLLAIKSAKTKLADRIPLAQNGIFIFINPAFFVYAFFF